MTAPKDGGPAFPGPSIEIGGHVAFRHDGQNGMSLRDWFAGQALAGMLANPETLALAGNVTLNAYRLADDMLAEREKGR